MTLAAAERIVDPPCDNARMRISAKADYAVRAALELAANPDDEPIKGERLAEAQDIPLQFLEHILLELKHARLVQARRGARGGYWLARPAEEITVADVIRAVEGPLANIHENAPEELHYAGPAERLRDVWVAVRQGLRAVLENVTLAELAEGELPWRIDAILNDPEAWIKR
jgi:Rrf2 family protein